MIDPLVAAFWAQTLTVEERVVRVIDTICMERVSRGAALKAHHLGNKAFYRCIRAWGIEDWIPRHRAPRQPYTRTANIKERPNPKWPLSICVGWTARRLPGGWAACDRAMTPALCVPCAFSLRRYSKQDCGAAQWHSQLVTRRAPVGAGAGAGQHRQRRME